ncbi:MurR/RpiR family transcriptional regulator [Saxibacter everestensis]|uniref:MurR/RpiR family transcriptional regulator n=1 Tax=Saxibacter everestensis TaxID=2909229 RepID=A0ABY8QVE3_9MICO|nr:MurR/RpiR family transcriptional regulator [Brevibacteriaceae bacterium ZFBP1038]
MAGSPMGIVNKIQAQLPDMTKAMARIGEFLLTQPEAVLRMTIMELAVASGSSPATVTRFCRQVGYEGYSDFRVAIAADAGRSAARESWAQDIGADFGPDDAAPEVLRNLLNSHLKTLQDTAAQLDLAAMTEVAKAAASARHIDIYGIGGSSLVGSELQARLYRIGINAFHWDEVHGGLTSAAMLDEGCLAFAISNTGRTKQTIEMLQEAKSAGATTVVLTNHPSSPLAIEADYAITTAVSERYLPPDDLSCKHAQMFLIDLLYLFIAQIDFPRTSTLLATTARAVSRHRQPRRYESGGS